VENGLDRVGAAVALLGVRPDKSDGEREMRQVRADAAQERREGQPRSQAGPCDERSRGA